MVPLGVAGTAGPEVPGPVRKDPGHVGERLHVVDAGGESPQAGFRGKRGANARHPPSALDGSDQRGLLPADERPGPFLQADGKGETGIEQVGAQESPFPGARDGLAQPADREGVLRADVDDSFPGADGVPGDRHPLEHGVRISLEHAAVHEGARVSLVGIADDELALCPRSPGQSPLGPGRETGPAPPAQAGVGDRFDDFPGSHRRDGLRKGLVPSPGAILLDGRGGDLAAVAQHDPLLPGEQPLPVHDPFLDHLAPAQVVHDDAVHPFRGHLAVEGPPSAVFDDIHQHLAMTQPDAPGLLERHPLVFGAKQLPEPLLHSESPRGDAARSQSNHHRLHRVPLDAGRNVRRSGPVSVDTFGERFGAPGG